MNDRGPGQAATAVRGPPAGTGSSAALPRRLRPQLFRIGTRIGRFAFVAIAAAVFVALVAAWWAATWSGVVGPLFLPSPGAVWHRMALLASEGTLWQDAGISLYRILVGFLIASAMAIPIGVIIGSFRLWEAAIEPLT